MQFCFFLHAPRYVTFGMNPSVHARQLSASMVLIAFGMLASLMVPWVLVVPGNIWGAVWRNRLGIDDEANPVGPSHAFRKYDGHMAVKATHILPRFVPSCPGAGAPVMPPGLRPGNQHPAPAHATPPIWSWPISTCRLS
jgi:hypothetical protein